MCFQMIDPGNSAYVWMDSLCNNQTTWNRKYRKLYIFPILFGYLSRLTIQLTSGCNAQVFVSLEDPSTALCTSAGMDRFKESPVE
jgi:hypothetical protein